MAILIWRYWTNTS